MTTNDEHLTSLAHVLIGLALQALVAGLFRLAAGSWTVGAWSGALVAVALFFGREHSQEERKAADRLGLPHSELWEELPVALACLWPPNWAMGNRRDFYAPVMAVLLSAAAVTVGGAL